jgi:hypothetical protein
MLTIVNLIKATCLLVLFSASQIYAQQSLIPSDTLVEGINPKYIDELRKFAGNINSNDLLICTEEEFRLDLCHSTENDKPKYLMLIPAGTIQPISYELGVITKRKPSKIEKMYISKMQKYIIKVFEDSKKKLIDPQSKYNSSNKDYFMDNAQSANGGEDYCTSSPDIFVFACDMHDRCYESDLVKFVCDEIFLADMRDYANTFATIDFTKMLTLSGLASVYYEAVVHHDDALNAYCSATESDEGNVCSDEPLIQQDISINREYNSDTWGGHWTGYTTYESANYSGNSSGSFRTVTESCERWEFGTVAGGNYYQLSMNCTYRNDP